MNLKSKIKLNTVRIKQLRKKRNLSVNEISNFLCITPNTYYRWERGEFVPTPNDIRVLAHILLVNVTYISDLESINVYDDIYTNKEIGELFNKKQLPVETQETLLKLNSVLRTLKNENSALKFENKRMRNSFQELQIPMYIKNQHLVFVNSNNVFNNVFLKDNEYAGKKNRDLFSINESDTLTHLEANILKSNSAINNHKIVLNGNVYLFFATPIQGNSEGETYILANLIDIECYEKIITRYSMFEYIIEHSNIAMWIKKLAPSRHYEFYSKKIESIFGYPYSSIKDNPYKWREIVHPEDLGIRIPFDPLIKSSEPKVYKYRITTSSEKIKWIQERIFFDSNSNRFIGMVTDITEELSEKNV